MKTVGEGGGAQIEKIKQNYPEQNSREQSSQSYTFKGFSLAT